MDICNNRPDSCNSEVPNASDVIVIETVRRLDQVAMVYACKLDMAHAKEMENDERQTVAQSIL